MLTSKQKSELKTIAHQNIKELVKFNIGKGEIDKNTITMLKNAFSKHELIKVSYLKSSLVNKDRHELTLDLLSKLNCDLVQEIGNTIILYKENKELPNHIVL